MTSEQQELVALMLKWLELHGEDRSYDTEFTCRFAYLGPVTITQVESNVVVDYDGGDDMYPLWTKDKGFHCSHWRDYLPLFRRALALEQLSDV